MQDLYGEREQLFDQLMQELEALRRTGQQYAENEAEYRKALRIAILEERSKGTPVTVISDLCRGRPDIAEKKQLRDCAEALYKASSEAIMAIKLRIKTVDADIQSFAARRAAWRFSVSALRSTTAERTSRRASGRITRTSSTARCSATAPRP